MAEDGPRPAPEPDRVPGAPHPRETRELFGQARAERAFLDAWARGRPHHAWLLRGPQGVGKATLAYRIARAAIADGGGAVGSAPGTPETLNPPQDCPVARRILAGAEPRLFVLRPGVNPDTGRARTRIAVEDVRAAGRFLHLSAADGGWRAVIVDAADQMTHSAANALLKSLEEPPERVLMLLIAHAPGGIPATIRSRCRFLDLAPLGAEDLTRALDRAGMDAPEGDETALAELAAGSAGRAMQLIAADGPALYAKLVAMTASGRVDRRAMSKLAAHLGGRDGAGDFAVIAVLLRTLTARLARAAALAAPPPPAAPREADLIALAASRPAQARHWAEASARIGASLTHAAAVNLDPAQTVMDTLLDLDAVLGQARRAA